jgi:sugar lactone lactonase YvrE
MRLIFAMLAFGTLAVCARAQTPASDGFLAFPPNEEIGAMSAVAIDAQDRVYVLHRGPKPLMAFDRSGKFLRSWGGGLFKVAHGLRIDRQGNIWTTDNGLHLIRKFSRDGKLLATLGEGELKFQSPDDLVFASNGDIVVADTGNARLVRISPQGKLIQAWGRKGKAGGEFATAHGLAIDSEDRIYVADRGNHRVQVFSLDGKHLSTWTGFGNPFGLHVLGGQLLVSDGDANRITHIDLATGAVSRQWGDRQTLQLPHLMANDSKGRLFVAEVNGKRVQIFRMTVQLSGSQTGELHSQDVIDEAHRTLFQSAPDLKRTASQVTAELAAKTAAARAPGAASSVPRVNFIDEHIFGRLQRDAVPHAPLASDEEFARRAWLDATGRIPPYEELTAFLEDRSPDKRIRLVDRLIASGAFIDKWTYYFEDLFRGGGRMGYGLNLFHYWIREWLKLDRPYNEVVTDLLTQGGKTSFSFPGGLYFARDFVKAKDDPEAPDGMDLVNIPDTVDEFTITYSKVFLGINLACISCHDGKGHLEKVNLFLTGKKREDFFRQAGFYGRTRQIMNWENGNQANQEYTVDDEAPGYDTKAESILRVPRNGGSSKPRFILSGEEPRPGCHERDELARILTSHIQFSRATTNRIWAELMGFGIVEPVDDFDLAREDQASNPELLHALAVDFQKNHYSIRKLIRNIMTSSAYQLSSRFEGQWEERYTSYYARKYARMLSAAELHDAITLATARPARLSSGAAKVEMVQQMADPKKADKEVDGFMKVFGQSNRDDMPKKTPPSSLQAMLLMQSKIVTDRVLAMGGSRVETLLASAQNDEDLIDRLWLATIARRATDAEREVARKALARDRRRGAENLQWALINSPEFIFNF